MPAISEMNFNAEVKSAVTRITLLHDILRKLYQQGHIRLEPGMRKDILLGSLLKLLHQAEVTVTLGATGCVEEILSVARTMAEVAVNGAYLQLCEDQEIDRFIHFEAQALYKHAKKLKPLVSRPPSPEVEEIMQKAVDAARKQTGRRDQDISWSIRGALLARAEYFDKSSGLSPLMVALVLTVYAWGHRAIHATYDALSPFIHAIPNEWVAFDDERQEQLAICLLAVSFVLFNFGLFMSRQLKTDVDVQLIAAHNAVYRET
jgi:hypothetical protein